MSNRNNFNIDAILFNDSYYDFTLSFNEKNDFKNNNLMNYCGPQIETDGLLAWYNTSNIDSWNNNTGFTITSLVSPSTVITTATTISDYGLTAFDVGLTNVMSGATLTLSNSDRFLSLSSVKYNNISGNTFSVGNITPVTGGTMGTYFNLSGGSYFQGVFKYQGYGTEFLPPRYRYGITIDSWINIESNTFTSITGNTDGILFYIGARAENKYTLSLLNSSLSGITESGLTTSYGNTLGPDSSDLEDSIYGNGIAFKFNKNKTITLRRIDEYGSINETTSDKIVTTTGWTNIVITYKPYEDLDLTCPNINPRLGDLSIYINGRLFWLLNDYLEFYTTDINTTKEKCVGVGYNISFGGGTQGLSNSYRFNTGSTFVQIPEQKDLLIEKNFNGSFTGGIQTLRIYNKSLNVSSIINNYKSEMNLYGKTTTFGGRLINL
jgi:hypothetical protein